MKTNSSDTAIASGCSCKKEYLRRNGASPNPENAPTSAPAIPTAMLVRLNILSHLKRPGSIPATIPVPSMKKNMMHSPCQLKLVHCLVMVGNLEKFHDKIASSPLWVRPVFRSLIQFGRLTAGFTPGVLYWAALWQVWPVRYRYYPFLTLYRSRQ